jgi:glycosyltransferase involved in cell wall biosynthesis
MNVLHIGTEKTWRGGENQIRLLIENSEKTDVVHHIAYPRHSPGFLRLSQLCPSLELPSTGSADIRSVLCLLRYCREQKIDLIAAQSSHGHSLGLWLKHFNSNLPLVVHRRVDSPLKRNFISKQKYTSSKVQHFIPVSRCIQNILLSSGVNESKMTLVYDSVDSAIYKNLNRLTARQNLLCKLNLPVDTHLIGNASALSPQKGHDVLINAVKILKDQNLNFHCLIAGVGVLQEYLQQLVKDLELQNHISFLGFVDNVPELLGALDVVAMPSNNEGLGSLLLEATYASCGIAATRVGGIPEFISHGHTGFLSPKGDASELAKNLYLLMTNPALRFEMVQHAQKHLQRHFCLSTTIEKTLLVYRQAKDASKKQSC